jgi:hypothetical protein
MKSVMLTLKIAKNGGNVSNVSFSLIIIPHLKPQQKQQQQLAAASSSTSLRR